MCTKVKSVIEIVKNECIMSKWRNTQCDVLSMWHTRHLFLIWHVWVHASVIACFLHAFPMPFSWLSHLYILLHFSHFYFSTCIFLCFHISLFLYFHITIIVYLYIFIHFCFVYFLYFLF